MKKLFIAAAMLITSAAHADQVYQCFGKDAYGQKITASLVVTPSGIKFNDKAAALDAKYKPSARKDMVRFLFTEGPDCGDLCSGGVLISKDVLTGAAKVFLTQEWGGEGYQTENYACFSK